MLSLLTRQQMAQNPLLTGVSGGLVLAFSNVRHWSHYLILFPFDNRDLLAVQCQTVPCIYIGIETGPGLIIHILFSTLRFGD